MDKAVDSETEILFTPDEISQIILSIKENDKKEIREKERYDRLMAEIEKAIECGDYEKSDALFKELQKPIE